MCGMGLPVPFLVVGYNECIGRIRVIGQNVLVKITKSIDV